MLNVEIRESTPADAEQIAEVNASAVATLRETYRPNQAAIANKKATVNSFTQLVAVSEGRVVGTVQYRLVEDRVHFLSLDVHESYRRLGVARQLMDALAEIGKRRGARKLAAYTVVQTGNCEIFTRMGFCVVSEELSPFFESDRFETVTEAYLERPIA